MSRFGSRFASFASPRLFAEFGQAATYIASDNTETSCTVILKSTDSEERGDERGEFVETGLTLLVRVTEVASIQTNSKFRVGSTEYVVQGQVVSGETIHEVPITTIEISEYTRPDYYDRRT